MKRTTGLKSKIEKEFEGKGEILNKLPFFEKRKEQKEMALAVLNALEEKEVLLIEAGTGVGKSFAYLLPSIIWAKEKKKKVIVSTYTKVLQYQLYNKDLPFLYNAMNQQFKYEVLLGQENFVCKRKLSKTLMEGLFDNQRERSILQEIRKWAEDSKGVFEEIPFEIPEDTKDKISRSSESCKGKKCPYYWECFYYEKKRNAEKAEIVVINHYLFFSNLASGEKVLPIFDALIFDEAHHLEEVGASFFGFSFSLKGIERELYRLYNPKKRKGLLKDFLKDYPWIENMIKETQGKGREFFSKLKEIIDDKKIIERDIYFSREFVYSLEKITEKINKIVKEIEDEDVKIDIKAKIQRIKDYALKIEELSENRGEDAVYWGEIRKERVYLNKALIDVSEMLKKHLFSKPHPCILTSATLTVKGSFSFFKERIGIEKAKEFILSSPFNYSERTVIYTPSDIPFPDEKNYEEKIKDRIEELLEITKGRGLVLFTSYLTMEKVLSNLNTKYKTFKQKKIRRSLLLESFRDDEESVLFGTKSFWEGIDVPGESLILVIITRLPFDVPDSPRIKAIGERLKMEGKDPFIHFHLPLSVLRFRQGAGRLMRKKDDFGIIAILDSRVTKKSYGVYFLDSLPFSPIVKSIEEVKNFIRGFLE